MELRRGCSAALILAAAWALKAQAAVVQLAPIPVEMAPGQSAAILSLTNKATAEVALQVRAFRWSQAGGEDALGPTDDLAISPAIASIPAGQTLSVRIIRLKKEPPVAEETYRVWVDELPAERGKAAGAQLKILTRYSVPVFFEADSTPGEPALVWALARTHDGLRLTVKNDGRRRARISGIQLRSADGKAAAVPPGSEVTGYALANQQMHWDLKPGRNFPIAPGGFRLEYDTESGPHRETVSLDAAP